MFYPKMGKINIEVRIMLTESGILGRLVAGGLRDVDRCKKGFIQVEAPDGFLLSICWPIVNSTIYAKFFLVTDLLSSMVEKERQFIHLSSDDKKRGYPIHKILCRMGVDFRIDGDLSIYTVTRVGLKSFDPVALLGKTMRVSVSDKRRPIFLVDIEGFTQAYWNGKEFVGVGKYDQRRLFIARNPIGIV